jgi:hypothetical protein
MNTITRTHKVAVTVDAAGIRVEPETLRMTSVDEVHWAGANANKFTIEFDGPGPFAERRLTHDMAATKQKPKRTGRYKYTVISVANPAVVLDPVVIVEEPPTGPPPTSES